MNKFKKQCLITAAASAIVVAIPSIADHTWGNASGPYHWDGASLPLQISVIDSVTSDWQDEMEETINQWNVSTVLNLTVNSSDNNGLNCPTANGQMRICNAAYGTNGWLGLASLNIDSGNHILYATAQLNDSYSMTQDERNSVMCQEVGHLFGLDHTSTNGSSQDTCMDYSSNPSDGVWPNAHDFEMLEEIYDHIGGGGGGGTGGELTNGVTESNLSGSTGEELQYYIDIPAGASNLNFAMSGGSGDADLYVNFGSEPTTSNWDCRPYSGGNNENCDFGSPNVGRYYVMIRGYTAFSGTSLTATYDEGGTPPPGCVSGGGVLCNGESETNLSASSSQEIDFTLEVPAGVSNLSFVITGGSGDADLYVNFGSQAQTNNWDCRPYRWGNEETCNFSSPNVGTYHVMLRAYSAFSGVTLTATYDGGSASVSLNQHPTRGHRINASGRHELWMKHNADNTTTLTHIYLAGESNQPH